MKIIRFIVVCLIVFATLGVRAQAKTDYGRLEAKAERFVQLQEWNSANAMYILMQEARPDDAVPYSKAIVSSGMLEDKKAQLDMLERTQKRGIPMDSVFDGVRKFSFEIGQARKYEEFLNLVKERQIWIARNINTRLLKYYDFRNDATNMVNIGSELLSATPDNIEYLLVVARGYMIKGDYENAVAKYKKVLELEADNYDALVALGNYYYVMWKASEGTRSQMSSMKTDALIYLNKANEIRPTDFVGKIISELSRP